MARLVLHLGEQDRLAAQRRRARDPVALRQHADDFGMRVLRNLPRQRAAIGLGHPVLGLDELVRRHPRLERGELLGILGRGDLRPLLQFGRVHTAFPTINRPIGQRMPLSLFVIARTPDLIRGTKQSRLNARAAGLLRYARNDNEGKEAGETEGGRGRCLKRVAFTMYPVKDMPRARAFYEETLGLPPSKYGAASPWVEFDLPGGGCLAITTVTPNEPSASAGGTIAFEVEDLPALVADLKAKGRRLRRRGHRKPGLPHGDLSGPRRQRDHPAQAEERRGADRKIGTVPIYSERAENGDCPYLLVTPARSPSRCPGPRRCTWCTARSGRLCGGAPRSR